MTPKNASSPAHSLQFVQTSPETSVPQALDVGSIHFAMPQDFAADEVMMSFRAPPPALKTPLLLNKQITVRPNLIVHRRPIDPQTSVELVCGEICAELASSIPDLQNLATSRLQFADQVIGMLVIFDYSARDASVRQYQAIRVDGGMLTTLSLTIDGLSLDQETHAHYVSVLTQATLKRSAAMSAAHGVS